MKHEISNQYGSLFFFASVTLLIAYSIMYQQLILPNDETGHYLRLHMVSLLWASVNFLNLIRLFITNRMNRLRLGGLILTLPAAWLTMVFSFNAIFYTTIIQIHPDGDGGRLPNLANDGALMVLVAVVVLAALGGWLFFFSNKDNQKHESNSQNE